MNFIAMRNLLLMLLCFGTFSAGFCDDASNPEFEKYREKIVAEWEQFRTNPKANTGAKVKWCFKVYDFTEYDGFEIVSGMLDSSIGKCRVVVVAFAPGFGKPAKKHEKFSKGDWIAFEGEFSEVNRTGAVVITNGLITAMGYRGEGDSPKPQK